MLGIFDPLPILRFDERSSPVDSAGVFGDELILRIQVAYPKVWYHCHTHHRGRADALSERESHVLGHLSRDRSRSPSELAEHMGIAASTLSEAVDKLVGRGLVERRVEPEDRRRVRYRLTPEGLEAIAATSVLSSDRLRRALERLEPDEREAAVHGLELLARGCVASGRDQASGGAS